MSQPRYLINRISKYINLRALKHSFNCTPWKKHVCIHLIWEDEQIENVSHNTNGEIITEEIHGRCTIQISSWSSLRQRVLCFFLRLHSNRLEPEKDIRRIFVRRLISLVDRRTPLCHVTSEQGTTQCSAAIIKSREATNSARQCAMSSGGMGGK